MTTLIRDVGRIAAALLGLIGAMYGASGATAAEPDFFQTVQGAAAPSLQAAPGADAAALGSVPAGTDGLVNLGCQDTSAADDATQPWCLIGYEEQAGWVRGGALAEGSGEDPPATGSGTAALNRTEWRPAGPIVPGVERYIRFGPRKGMGGSGGCNQFHGRFEQDGEALSIGPLVIRPIACRDHLVDEETDFLSALTSTHRGVAFRDILVLLDDQGLILMHLVRSDRD
ncbi:MAG: META domain-containing protein [Pseudomonadota bacterium]